LWGLYSLELIPLEELNSVMEIIPQRNNSFIWN
jgi:hypothetical protein